MAVMNTVAENDLIRNCELVFLDFGTEIRRRCKDDGKSPFWCAEHFG
jgi:hypothetical protein